MGESYELSRTCGTRRAVWLPSVLESAQAPPRSPLNGTETIVVSTAHLVAFRGVSCRILPTRCYHAPRLGPERTLVREARRATAHCHPGGRRVWLQSVDRPGRGGNARPALGPSALAR